ncbi:MAG: hypothetical protein NWE86_05090 [Candidatus Bathyarchaeota archaeon]|nr:hypothetical protein [Candidatus Bathyarchaeota archaeon]
MKKRLEISSLSDSAIFKFSDKKVEKYSIEIWPKRSAEYFANLFLDGILKMKDTEVDVMGLGRRNLGEAMCQVALFQNYGLIKCDTPFTGESRTLEIFPREFALWLAKCLESRNDTRVEYKYFN